MKLLVNASNFFEELFNQINKAEKSIEIRMFIWRDDIIGNQVLEKLYEKAIQGIEITIYKDVYGVIFEKSEENQLSLFHKEKQLKLDFIAKILTKGYHPYAKRLIHQVSNERLNKFLSLPNVHVESKLFKDHSKYFIFDDKTLIVSGINIEDKEIYGDIQGRAYQDYALLIYEQEEVTYFKKRCLATETFDSERHVDYLIRNDFNKDQEHLISFINNANESIVMHMAYFGNKTVNHALYQAIKRGVDVNIITSEVSNIQVNFNSKQINEFIKMGIKVYLYPGIVHAKAILFDHKVLMVGSWNLNNAAIKKLYEFNVMTKDKEIIERFIEAHDVLLSLSSIVDKKLKYQKIKALIESIYS